MKIEITEVEFNAAMNTYNALREAFEMRLNQHLYVEALFLDVDGESCKTFVACYDYNENGDYTCDFSTYDEMMIAVDECKNRRFFKFDSLADFHLFVSELMSTELTDDIA